MGKINKSRKSLCANASAFTPNFLVARNQKMCRVCASKGNSAREKIQKMSIEETVRTISTLTTRDDAGRHFTELLSRTTISILEGEGLVTVVRPVHRVVRGVVASIDYAPWSSIKARTEGLRRVAIAQLGTADTLDGEQFIREFRVAATARVVPLFLDAAAGIARRNNDERQASKIEAVAETCRRGMSPEAARQEMRELHPLVYANVNPYAKAYANVYGDANAYAAANAYADAHADAYAYAYANAYANSDPNADAYAHSYANAYANATTYYANAGADAGAGVRDKFLRAVTDSVEAALRACGSPGIALLDQLPLTPATETAATE